MRYVLFFLLLLFLANPGTAAVPAPISIEKQYSVRGIYPYRTLTYPVKDSKLKKLTVCLPESPSGREKTIYPVIVYCNGTNVPVSACLEVLEHLASWGFIAIGSEEKYSGKGSGAITALNFLLQQNQLADSPFYQKVNTSEIGVAGHSQGGAGAFNAASRYPESSRFKALFAACPVNIELANSLIMRCSYDLSKLKLPVMLTASSSPDGWDATTENSLLRGICDLQFMRQAFGILQKNSNSATVIARLAGKDKNHANALGESLPYMTAWFAYHLQNNKDAGKFFNSPAPELANNPRWQDVAITIP